MIITDVVQTCTACPSQWEARTADGRPVYIRYRHGYLSVRVGPVGGDVWSAVRAEEWFGDQLVDEDDGWISLDEVCRIAGLQVAGPAGPEQPPGNGGRSANDN